MPQTRRKKPQIVQPDAKARALFIQRVVARFGNESAAARALGVTRAAIWRWGNVSLSVEAACTLAEVMGLPYEEALPHATRTMPVPAVRRATPAAPPGAGRPNGAGLEAASA